MGDYEMGNCLKIRDKLSDKIKGKIFVGRNDNDISISINCAPGCHYRASLENISDMKLYMLTNSRLESIADAIYEDYRTFIFQKFFI